MVVDTSVVCEMTVEYLFHPSDSEKASLSVPASRGGNEVFGSGGVHNSPGGLRQLPHHFPGLTQRSHTNQERISSSLAEIVEVEIEVVSPSIVPSGNFSELKSYCHLYGAQGQRQAYLLPMPR
ncbi:uncharacterized protein TNCV_2405641 [Trichonephila clavipes]|nr:uncharacterized protein TNCV_2405641 [Trichonephila clavipes]